MALRNIPFEEPFSLAELAVAAPGQVSSLTMASGPVDVHLTVLAFSAGEGVSETSYAEDTLYLVIDGTLSLSLAHGVTEVPKGSAIAILSATPHAIAGKDGDAFTILQLEV